MSVENKVIVITGASSGIGEASAKLLASHGAKVVLGARRESRLQELVRAIAAQGGQAAYRVTDVTNPADLTAPISALKTDEWNAMIEVNLKGVLNGVAAVMPEFTRQKHGQIITTSSVAGLKSFAGSGVYGATKFAVRNLMEVIRMESAQEQTNIRTTSLYPAAINTELLHTITDASSKQGMNKLYASVGITPDAVARVVDFAVAQPADVNVNEFTIYPTKQG